MRLMCNKLHALFPFHDAKIAQDFFDSKLFRQKECFNRRKCQFFGYLEL